METIQLALQQIAAGKNIEKTMLLALAQEDVSALCQGANSLRAAQKGDKFEFCSIINGKSGKCSEDCKYCAQSIHYPTEVFCHGLLSAEEILAFAQNQQERGVTRFSVVTSGKALTEEEIEQLCGVYREIRKQYQIECCASHGLLNKAQLQKLKDAGITRYHNNLETSRRFFPQICTTHTYDDKIATILVAKEVGLSICSGGIIGLGETMEDRIDMALQLRELGVSSVPINIFNPIPGTPLAGTARLPEAEICQTVALFRFALPQADIRLAGGRGLLADKGKQPFLSGANATITGDMLTTAGISVETDKQLLQEIGFSFLSEKK